MYVKLENNIPVEWPVQAFQIRSSLNYVSFPTPIADEDVLQFGFEPYQTSDKPEFNELVEAVEETTPVKQGNVWTQQWQVNQLHSPEERERILTEDATKKAEEAAKQLQESIVSATQSRLDEFAKTKNYDNIVSACTYATSADPIFAAEGQRAVDLRTSTWRKLYEILAEVEAGTRPTPTGFEDIEPELPVLSWE